MSWKRVMLILLFSVVNSVYSSKILAVFPVFLKSHSIFTHGIVKELAARGHEVTIITPFEEKNPLPNYKQILADQKSCWDEDYSEAETEMFIKDHPPFIIQEYIRWTSLHWFTEAGFNSTPVHDFIQDDESHFDLIITELFLQEAYLMFAHKYKAPVVMLSSFGIGHLINEQMGNPMILSAAPFEFIDFFGPMNIKQRIKNVIWTMIDLYGRRFMHLPEQQKLAQLHFSKLPQPLPNLADIERNVSLILINTHFSIDTVRPNVPGIVEVGGVHITPPKGLPADLKKFCDEATDGVIYYSLGTIMKGSQMSKKRVEAFVNVFSKIKQRVLWKWEGENPPKVSKNVILANWLPQAEILAHPNTKLFITHGGLLGMQESIYYGVPIIGMPFYGDQQLNVDRAVKTGYGIQLLFKDANEDRLKNAIDQIITNPSYVRRAKEVSKIFKDKPQSPMETAMFWIEYVIRNNGAVHMKSPILDLYWYEYLLIDVVVILWMGTITVGAIVTFFIYILCKLLCFRKQYKKIKKQ